MNDELRQRTDEVHDANVFLETILAGLQAAVVVLDSQLRVETWNARAEDLWGVRAHETVGQHFMNVDIGLDVRELHAPIRAAFGGEGEADLVVDATNRRGRAIRCRVSVSPMHTHDGSVRGVIVLMEDEPVEE